MKFNKNIYKYSAIISFTIVIMLVANLVAPMFTMAEETGTSNAKGFLSGIEYNENESTISVSGTLPQGLTNYKLYWSVGEIPMQKLPQDATSEQKDKKIDNLIEWSTDSNHLLNDVISSNSTNINSTIKIKNDRTTDVQYNALCIATNASGARTMQLKTLKLGAKVVIENTISIDLNVNDNKINISVKDPNYDINKVKFVKNNDVLTVASFEGLGEELQIQQGKNINLVKEVSESGKYYVYAETTAGTKSAKSCIVDLESEKEEEGKEEPTTQETEQTVNQEQENKAQEVKEEQPVDNKEPEIINVEIQPVESNEPETKSQDVEPVKAPEPETKNGETDKAVVQEPETQYEEIEPVENQEPKTENEKVETIVIQEPEKENNTNKTDRWTAAIEKIIEKSNQEKETIVENNNKANEDKKEETINKEANKDDEVIEVNVNKNQPNKTVENDEYITIEDLSDSKNEENSNSQKEDDKNENENQKQIEDKEIEVIAVENNNDNKAQKAQEDIPQAGSNDTPLIVGIVAFSMMGIFSFIKYRKED